MLQIASVTSRSLNHFDKHSFDQWPGTMLARFFSSCCKYSSDMPNTVFSFSLKIQVNKVWPSFQGLTLSRAHRHSDASHHYVRPVSKNTEALKCSRSAANSVWRALLQINSYQMKSEHRNNFFVTVMGDTKLGFFGPTFWFKKSKAVKLWI